MLHEIRKGTQLPWENEIKEGPEFFEVVLHRRTREDDAVARLQLPTRTKLKFD
jgi:hypothetical protein